MKITLQSRTETKLLPVAVTNDGSKVYVDENKNGALDQTAGHSEQWISQGDGYHPVSRQQIDGMMGPDGLDLMGEQLSLGSAGKGWESYGVGLTKFETESGFNFAARELKSARLVRKDDGFEVRQEWRVSKGIKLF